MLSNKNLRNNMRLLHLITAGVVGTFIYSPWSADPTFAFATRWIVLPILIITGFVMWQQPRLTKLLRRRSPTSTAV
jgi:hypothetical protein